jgi:hypothetical protein
MGECSPLTVWFAKHCNRLILNGAPSQFEMGLGGHPSSEKKGITSHAQIVIIQSNQSHTN